MNSEKSSFLTRRTVVASLVLATIIVSCAVASTIFMRMWERDLIIPGPGVTKVVWLSEYFPALKGSPGDTQIFFLDSGVPGATISVMGGTHPDETAGTMTAVVLIENAIVKKGRLIVMPQSNASGFSHNLSQEAFPQYIHYTTRDGSVRRFRGGSRQTNPIHHWPDPEVFVHYPTGQKLSGEEVRNLNRGYPGREDGTFTEKVAYAITTMVRNEKVDVNMDLHEAWPEYPFINAIGTHERARDLATFVAMNLQSQNIPISVEMSPEKFRGLTYRELGDYTSALTLLSETPSAVISRLRGVTDETLAIEGKDAFIADASKLKRTFVPFTEEGWPMTVRVGRNLAMIQEIMSVYSEDHPDKEVEMEGVPTYDEIITKQIGDYLKPASSKNN